MSTDFTPCPFCALQCGVAIQDHVSTKRVVGNPKDPINEGYLCQKGLASLDVLHHSRRLVRPMIREAASTSLVPTSWAHALDMTVARIHDIQKKWSRESIAVYGSGALTNETAYLVGKFARLVLGTTEIDYNGRFCMSSAAKAYVTMLGLDRPTSTFHDVRQADTLLFVGSNLTETHPMAMRAPSPARLLTREWRRPLSGIGKINP
jgi:assimilatory nitrate reductase catalytic subunit